MAVATRSTAVQAAWVAYNRVFGTRDETDTHLMIANAQTVEMERGRYGIGAYADWFEKHRDWFSDPGDLAGMRWIMKSLLNTGIQHSRKTLVNLRGYLPDAEVQNWYMRYAMFDPTMGMLNPDEARDFYLQRMTKRFNLLVLAIEEGAK
jgi:hypothetical protein